MTLFSSTRLEQLLSENYLDSWTKTKYMILVTVLYSSTGPAHLFTPYLPKQPPVYPLAPLGIWLLIIVITYFGVKKCYLTNKAADGTDFIGRFIVLYVPISFKLLFVGLILLVFAAMVSRGLSVEKDQQQNFFAFMAYLIGPAGTYLFYVFLNRSFRRLVVLINEKHESS